MLEGRPPLHGPPWASFTLAWPRSPDQDQGGPQVTLDQISSLSPASGSSLSLLDSILETRTYRPSSQWFPSVTLSFPRPSCPLKQPPHQNGPASPWNVKSCKENGSHPKHKKSQIIHRITTLNSWERWDHRATTRLDSQDRQTPLGEKGQSAGFPRAEHRGKGLPQKAGGFQPGVSECRRVWGLTARAPQMNGAPRQTAWSEGEEQGHTCSDRNRESS